jgi:glutathione S-transferase
MRDALVQLQSLLRGRETFLDAFSYADIAVAPALQFVAPVSDRFIHLGPASRRAWGDPELAAEFAGLVAWRDHLCESYRRPAATDRRAPKARASR